MQYKYNAKLSLLNFLFILKLQKKIVHFQRINKLTQTFDK